MVEHTAKLHPGGIDDRMMDVEETNFMTWLLAELKDVMLVDAVMYIVVEECGDKTHTGEPNWKVGGRGEEC